MSLGDTFRLAVDPLQFFSECPEYAMRRSLSERYPANVGGVCRGIKLTSDAGKKPLRQSDFAKFLLKRVIVIGHDAARRDVALFHLVYTSRHTGMSTGEMGVTSRPQEPAAAIAAFMRALRYDQRGFAAKLNVTQSTVSRWITGEREPGAEMYYRMARLSPRLPEAEPLLSRAQQLSGSFLPPQRPKTVGREESEQIQQHAVAIPLLKDAAAAGAPLPAPDADVEEILPFPATLIRHPSDTVAIRVQGDSMSPVLEDGYIAVIDAADRDRLYDEIVAARNSEGEVVLRWLRKSGSSDLLVAQSGSRRFQPVVLNEEWSIIGKVLWWVGKVR